MTDGHKQLKRWVKHCFDTQQEAANFLQIPKFDAVALNKIINTNRIPELEKLHIFEEKAGIPIRAWMRTSRLAELTSAWSPTAKKAK